MKMTDEQFAIAVEQTRFYLEGWDKADREGDDAAGRGYFLRYRGYVSALAQMFSEEEKERVLIAAEPMMTK